MNKPGDATLRYTSLVGNGREEAKLSHNACVFADKELNATHTHAVYLDGAGEPKLNPHQDSMRLARGSCPGYGNNGFKLASGTLLVCVYSIEDKVLRR